MRLVVDASVAVKWLIDEPGSDLADRLLDGDHDLQAPELLLAEVLNAAWRRQRAGDIDSKQYAALVHRSQNLPATLRPLAPLATRAATIARDLDHPVYDCFYLALAEVEDAPLVTADRRFLARLATTSWADLVKDLATTSGGS